MMRVASLAALLSAASAAELIPRTILQTSKDAAVDRLDWIEYRESLKAANPNFDLQHYSDDEARAFVAEHYGGTVLEKAYDAVTPIMRADLFRLAAIYQLGGFYMDMDMLGKSSLEPLAASIDDGEVGAAFPKEWWMSDEFYERIYPGKGGPEDDEDHWQMGQYAFAAKANHPFVKDVLEEAVVRCVNLMKEKGDEEIKDMDILKTTGPHLFTELYHKGRKEGKYGDVLHLQGDSEEPVMKHRHGGHDWHKFGPYAEHMLSHTWTSPDRRNLETYDAEYVPAPAPDSATPPSSPTGSPPTYSPPTVSKAEEADEESGASSRVASAVAGAAAVLVYALA